MKVLHKILAVNLMVILLASTLGFTLEHHFCNHCNKSFETAWFLIPSNNDISHECSCSHDEDEHACCEGECEIDQAKHVEHFNAKITSLIPQENQDEIPSIHLFAQDFFLNQIQNFKQSTFNGTAILIVPRPPNLLPLNIEHCCFLI